MPHDRFFVEGPFTEGSTVDLTHEARHLKVMRVREGEAIELVNGRNQLAQARLHGTCATIERLTERPPPPPLILCQAIPRPNRLDFIVEKGTELGMTELWLFPGERSEKKALSPTQLARYEQITIAAMKQCGRLDLPKIALKPPLKAWTELPCAGYYGAVGEAPQFSRSGEEVCFFIGPESGFTDEEEKHLERLGALGVSLHPNILRTETATLVALALASKTS